MIVLHQENIKATLIELYNDAKNDKTRIIKGLVKSIIRPMQPEDFKHAYLSITEEQGLFLVELIKKNKFKNIVEFGTSFGISTLFLAQGALETKGRIITTELIASKAEKAMENFKKAEVSNIIDVRIGDAMQTLQNHKAPIDLLFLDGWKDLYQPLFNMLESNFHTNTIIYVDNANMTESRAFLKEVGRNDKYTLESIFDGKVVLIRIK
ncbi:O-methyltransferase [Maribacter aquivivus]|uniref:O-methyltransferase n=1 Tax=Maribacter aquivivus TaxID=228958 RepID=A0A1M6QCH3_9FLAO|nr:class I SAM-dependent methyltransferase [Maribacter aquivivus]SHK17868.1 O-methyltransferase [Maribacter aquivivus]|tara:strand:- start:18734 stop:19360 length:627 start_codon:yes stop_codon:yes gene_type:complete